MNRAEQRTETSTEVAKPVVKPVGRTESAASHGATAYATTVNAASTDAPPTLGIVSPDTANDMPTVCTTVELDSGVANVPASVKE